MFYVAHNSLTSLRGVIGGRGCPKPSILPGPFLLALVLEFSSCILSNCALTHPTLLNTSFQTHRLGFERNRLFTRAVLELWLAFM